MYNAASRLAKPVAGRGSVWCRRLVFSLLQDTVGLGQGFVTCGRGVVGSFSAGRGDVVGSVLEPGHVRSFETGVVAWARSGCVQGLALVFLFHRLHLGLALDLGVESRLAIGVDRLLREVVGSAAGWRARLVVCHSDRNG